MKKLKVIILARGGSKRLPGKNIKKINNIPLLGYPILASQKTKHISDIYVSTDDDEIKKVALEYGGKVIDRPSEFAQDDSLDIDAMKHAVEYLQSYDDIVHLRSTTPMIKSSILDNAIEYFLDNSECTSLRSAHEVDSFPEKMFKKQGKYWSGLFNESMSGEYYNLPRQKFSKTYKPNGHIDIVRPDYFMKNNSFHGDKILCYLTEFIHDIDNLSDFNLLKKDYEND
jgi:CMP-N-acetylneuraminic acid synthetase